MMKQHKWPLLPALSAAAAGLVTAAPAGAGEEWNYMASPLFLWAQSIDGSSSINGREAPLDPDFQDNIPENLDADRSGPVIGLAFYF